MLAARLMSLYPVRKLLGPGGRLWAWRRLGAQIAQNVAIGPRVTMRIPSNVTIGTGSSLGGRVNLDSWGTITIGSCVLMNGDVDLLTGQHHVDSPTFQGDVRPIVIGDYVWMPLRIMVMPGVKVGECAVIGSGSVVTNDVPAYGVAVGNPAGVVKNRAQVPYTYVPASPAQARLHRAWAWVRRHAVRRKPT
jgi:putative colanic acid biosynthesis acetyltransferase WcaF